MPQKFLSIKNFEKYQTYKHSNPPWFKIHKKMFGDAEFIKLTPAYRYLYIGLIYLAVETNNKVYNDTEFLIQRLYISRTDLVQLAYTPRTRTVRAADTTRTEAVHNPYTTRTQIDLRPLYRAGFLETSNLRRTLSGQSSYSTVQDSTEQDRAHAEHAQDEFDEFWKHFPRKVDKERARKAWDKLNSSRPETCVLLHALAQQKQSEQWIKNDGAFIPYPATWLKGKRWNDEAQPMHTRVKSMMDIL